MLIKITQSCSNGCIHCFDNAKPSTNHMTLDTFKAAISFAQKYDVYSIGNLISGGEPTEHPKFEDFIDVYYSLYSLNVPCVVITNGHWIIDNQEKVLQMLDKYPGLFFQVTYDSRYYPKKLDLTKRILRQEHIVVVTSVDNIIPIGRAKENNIPIGYAIKAPKCLNFKLIRMQNVNQLKEIIKFLRMNNKVCIPAIQWDGEIAFGESALCKTSCNIFDSEEKILFSMLHNQCEICDYLFKDRLDSKTLALLDKINNS